MTKRIKVVKRMSLEASTKAVQVFIFVMGYVGITGYIFILGLSVKVFTYTKKRGCCILGIVCLLMMLILIPFIGLTRNSILFWGLLAIYFINKATKSWK